MVTRIYCCRPRRGTRTLQLSTSASEIRVFPPAMVRASLFPMSDARSLRGSRCEGRSAKVCPSSDSVHPRANLEIPQRLSGWKYVRVRTAGDGHGMWAEWGIGSARHVVHGLRGLQGGRVMPPGPGSSGPRSRQGCFEPSGIGHGLWASVVGGHGVSAKHAIRNGSCICVYASRSSRRHTPCVVLVCVR